MIKTKNIELLPKKIAIFPLTGAVLFPGTQLPLNIFEPRYLAMIEDALQTPERRIGMVQPLNDEGTLFDVGCAGRISYFQESGDGRYMIALTVPISMGSPTPAAWLLTKFF